MKITIELSQVEINWLEGRTHPQRESDRWRWAPGKTIMDKVHKAVDPSRPPLEKRPKGVQ